MVRSVCAMVGAVALFGVLGATSAEAAGRVIAVDGVSKHAADVRVEILVEVPAGQSASKAADRALEAQGAKRAPKPPPESSGFAFNGLFWDTLPVVQGYNPAGQPTGAAEAALRNTYSDWNGVPGSSYRIGSGGTTSRCPSLVRRRLGAPERHHAGRDVVQHVDRRGRHGAEHPLPVEHGLRPGARRVRPRDGVPPRERPCRRSRSLVRRQCGDVPVVPDGPLLAVGG
jgi:hypothetical protein